MFMFGSAYLEVLIKHGLRQRYLRFSAPGKSTAFVGVINLQGAGDGR